MKKVIVIGTTGSGKSTFASQLAKKIEASYVSLDLLFWKADWQGSTDEEFIEKIRHAIATESWIVDGNYSRTQEVTWPQADTIIWIDLPFWLTFYQCLARAINRALSKNELWPGTGNVESFSRILSKDSILLWLIKTYKRNKVRYEQKQQEAEASGLRFHRLCSRKEMREFLQQKSQNSLASCDFEGSES